jgi:hypothetical protein
VRDVDPRVSILNFHYAWPEAATLNAGLDRVVSFDETGFASPGDRVAARETDDVYRRQAWEFLMAGGGIFSMLDYSFAVGHEDGTLVNRAPGGGSPALRRQLRVLKDFLHSFASTGPPGSQISRRLHARSGQKARVYVRGGAERLGRTPAGDWRSGSTRDRRDREGFLRPQARRRRGEPAYEATPPPAPKTPPLARPGIIRTG